MSRRDRILAFAIAIPGAFCCVAALALFLGRIVRNEMSVSPGGSAREYYLGIGDAYSGGFVTGFFLSFFLMVLAVAIGTFFEQHRARRQVRPAPAPTPERASN
jgi:glycerol uptake facilitator-like aquaporin